MNEAKVPVQVKHILDMFKLESTDGATKPTVTFVDAVKESLVETSDVQFNGVVFERRNLGNGNTALPNSHFVTLVVDPKGTGPGAEAGIGSATVKHDDKTHMTLLESLSVSFKLKGKNNSLISGEKVFNKEVFNGVQGDATYSPIQDMSTGAYIDATSKKFSQAAIRDAYSGVWRTLAESISKSTGHLSSDNAPWTTTFENDGDQYLGTIKAIKTQQLTLPTANNKENTCGGFAKDLQTNSKQQASQNAVTFKDETKDALQKHLKEQFDEASTGVSLLEAIAKRNQVATTRFSSQPA